MTATAARAIASELRAIGVDHFFLVTGRDTALWIALQEAGIRQVLARSESSAVYMADAYARMTGRPTFVYGAFGPGAANVAAALAEPYWSSSPLIALCSAMRREARYHKEYQELDQIQLFSAVTKWSAEAAVAKQVPRLLRDAVRHALGGTPGPVYLGIPGDVLEDEIPGYEEPVVAAEPPRVPLSRPSPTLAEADGVVEALRSAKRPVILAGNGIHQSVAYEPLRLVAERLGVPVATSMAGKGSIPDGHPLALGTVGRYSRKYANAAVRDADVILAIGTGLGGLVTNSNKLIADDAELIHVTMDPDAIGQNVRTRTGVVADACSFLTVMLDACDRQAIAPPLPSEHIQHLHDERASWLASWEDLAARDGTDGRTMRPEAVMAELNRQVADDATVVADTGFAAAWAGALAETRVAGRQYLRADGSLGWAFPAALGAQLAMPDRQVISIIGDGGFGYHVAELETALRIGLPVIVVILNNQTLAFEAHTQQLLYGRVVPEVNDFCDVDYGQVARSFGVNGFRTTSVPELREALGVALQRRAPTVIDAVIDRDAIAPVTRYDSVRVREL